MLIPWNWRYREWREKQNEIIAERDEAAKRRHEETIKKAREDIDKFYDDYNEKKEKNSKENRANQEIGLQQITTGNLWERVLRQIDLASKHVASQSGENESSKSLAFGNSKSSSSQAHIQSPFPQSQKRSILGSSTNLGQSSITGSESLAHTRDTTRMRELLQDLKKNPKAPGIATKD